MKRGPHSNALGRALAGSVLCYQAAALGLSHAAQGCAVCCWPAQRGLSFTCSKKTSEWLPTSAWKVSPRMGLNGLSVLACRLKPPTTKPTSSFMRSAQQSSVRAAAFAASRFELPVSSPYLGWPCPELHVQVPQRCPGLKGACQQRGTHLLDLCSLRRPPGCRSMPTPGRRAPGRIWARIPAASGQQARLAADGSRLSTARGAANASGGREGQQWRRGGAHPDGKRHVGQADALGQHVAAKVPEQVPYCSTLKPAAWACQNLVSMWIHESSSVATLRCTSPLAAAGQQHTADRVSTLALMNYLICSTSEGLENLYPPAPLGCAFSTPLCRLSSSSCGGDHSALCCSSWRCVLAVLPTSGHRRLRNLGLGETLKLLVCSFLLNRQVAGWAERQYLLSGQEAGCCSHCGYVCRCMVAAVYASPCTRAVRN